MGDLHIVHISWGGSTEGWEGQGLGGQGEEELENPLPRRPLTWLLSWLAAQLGPWFLFMEDTP